MSSYKTRATALSETTMAISFVSSGGMAAAEAKAISTELLEARKRHAAKTVSASSKMNAPPGRTLPETFL